MHLLKITEIKEILWSKNVRLIIVSIFLAEILSFISFYSSNLRFIIFPLILISFLIICFYKLELGVYIVLIELFIGSMGQMFYWNYFGINLSIRLLIWFILLLVWFIKVLKNDYKAKILKSEYLIFLIPLFIFVVWGILKGFINNNGLANIFFDFNAWLYFALIFPFYDVILKRNNSFKTFFQIIITSSLWLSIKTFIVLFIFTHNLEKTMGIIYRWIRDTRIGEITQMPDTFTRVFFQSHIFILVTFFILFVFLNKAINKKDKKLILNVLALMVLVFAVIIISFSRSFWVGCFLGFLFFIFLIYINYGFKKAVINSGLMAGIMIFSLVLITVVVKIPIGGDSAQFNTTSTLKNRAKNVKNEAAVSSRWNLLPKLWDKIEKNPIMGGGFGATVTYQSNDPRVLETNPDGQYTTYAFEWGWLDIWLKLGFLGFLFYIAIILKLIMLSLNKKSIRKTPMISSLIIGVFIITIINFFTPYLNHPLGIGYLIFSIALIDKLK